MISNVEVYDNHNWPIVKRLAKRSCLVITPSPQCGNHDYDVEGVSSTEAAARLFGLGRDFRGLQVRGLASANLILGMFAHAN